MPNRIGALLERLAHLEQEIEVELNTARDRWAYRLEAGRVRFERDASRAHARFRQSIPAFLRKGSLGNLLTAPIIYAVILPIALLDLVITMYQHICFRVYGIALVRRSKYVACPIAASTRPFSGTGVA